MIHQMFLFVRDWSKRSVNEYPSARAEEVLRAPPPPPPNYLSLQVFLELTNYSI